MRKKKALVIAKVYNFNLAKLLATRKSHHNLSLRNQESCRKVKVVLHSYAFEQVKRKNK